MAAVQPGPPGLSTQASPGPLAISVLPRSPTPGEGPRLCMGEAGAHHEWRAVPAQHQAAGPPGHQSSLINGATPTSPRLGLGSHGIGCAQVQEDVTWSGLQWTRAGGHMGLPQKNHGGLCQVPCRQLTGTLTPPFPWESLSVPTSGPGPGLQRVLGVSLNPHECRLLSPLSHPVAGTCCACRRLFRAGKNRSGVLDLNKYLIHEDDLICFKTLLKAIFIL